MADAHVTIVRTRSEALDPSYFVYLLSTAAFQDFIYATMVAGATNQIELSRSGLANLRVPVPPLDEQRAIADFLDRETARIDALIAKKNGLLTLLEQRIQSILDAEVAPNALPIGWTEAPLRYLSTIQTGLTLGKAVDDAVTLTERPYLRVANVQDGFLDLSEITTVKVEASRADRHTLEPGDVLMTEGGDFDKLGRGTVWDGQIAGCLHQNHIFAVRPRRSVLNPQFLALQLRTVRARAHFTSTSSQSTNLASTNRQKVGDYRVAYPSLSSQLEIVVRAVDKQRQDQALTKSVRQGIEKLREYRTALISAAVTGQIPIPKT